MKILIYEGLKVYSFVLIYSRNRILEFPSQQIIFFPRRIMISLLGIVGRFISTYLWRTISWNVDSGYDRFNEKERIMCIFHVRIPRVNLCILAFLYYERYLMLKYIYYFLKLY